MKIRLMLALIPILFLATACSQSEDTVAADITRGCELVNATSWDETIPEVAVEFFASAARADIEYLPLAEAVKMSRYSVWTASEATRNEVFKSSNLIRAYCTPRLAK